MTTEYRFTFTGITPLLMHADNIEWADFMDEWKNDPKNKKGSKAGDDRSPAWRWLGSLYHDDNVVCIPADNIMRCVMEAGAAFPVPGGKNGKTFKSQTQSGLIIQEPFLALGPTPIPMKKVMALREVEDFKEHMNAVRELGFSLFTKRAKIGSSKHIRVRPRFDQWTVTGHILVTDPQITKDILAGILSYAGRYKGLGDWRPGGRTPGSFGMFEAVLA